MFFKKFIYNDEQFLCLEDADIYLSKLFIPLSIFIYFSPPCSSQYIQTLNNLTNAFINKLLMFFAFLYIQKNHF